MKTNSQLPSPHNTLVILLGADHWPYHEGLRASPAFSNAAQQMRHYLMHSFGLPPTHLLDLFNTEINASAHYLRIQEFLKHHLEPQAQGSPVIHDLLVYFVGHAELFGRDGQLLLAIQDTHETIPTGTAVQISTLAVSLKEWMRHIRLYLVLDCCFAGAALRTLVQGDELQAVKALTDNAFLQEDIAQSGMVLLCSSDHKTLSRLLQDESSTAFSWAFLKALTSGKEEGPASLSFQEVHRLLEEHLRRFHHEAPHTVIHVPDQSKGDISLIPFFPNPAFKPPAAHLKGFTSKYVGESFIKLSDWLAQVWLKEGPSVCCIDGFPGVGKTSLAHVLMNATDRISAIIEMPDAGVSQASDLLHRLSTRLTEQGQADMARVLNSDLAPSSALIRLLHNNVVIIIDEFQHALFDTAGRPINALTRLIEEITHNPRLPGRLLLLSNRIVDRGSRWTERVEIQTLLAPGAPEAEQLLDELLLKNHMDQKLLPERKRDIVEWLGCNPRALRVLVAALRGDTLDDLVGLRPELWEWWRDRPVSSELIKDLEQELLQRTIDRLSAQSQRLLSRFAVYRTPVKKEALEAQLAGDEELVHVRNELLDMFLMEHYNGWFNLHPIVREVSLNNLKKHPTEFKQAHRKAANHYLRHFTAKNIVNSEKLGGYFVEARYHLARCGREEDLSAIAERFTNHLQTVFKAVSPVPTMPDELDETIAILSIALDKPGPTGLEVYLARLYKERGRPDDLEAAVIHIRRATQARAISASWMLRIQIEEQVHGVERALQVCRQGIARIPADKGLVALYESGGGLLAQVGRFDEAITLLKEGISRIPADKNLFALYESGGRLLVQAGRFDEAIALLKEGIARIPADKGLVALYESGGSLLAQAGRFDEAITLLREGILRIPADKNLFALYESVGGLLAQAGRFDEAIALLKEGIVRIPADKGLVVLYESEGGLLVRAGRLDEAIALLREGILRIPADKNLFVLYESGTKIFLYAGKSVEAITFLREGLTRLPFGGANRYRLEEVLLYCCLAMQDIYILESTLSATGTLALEPGQRVLGQVLRLYIRHEWKQAMEEAHLATIQFPRYMALVVLEAFACLCIGEDQRAYEILQLRPLHLTNRHPNGWFQALVAFKNGDREMARASLSLYLERTMDNEEEVTMDLLLRLWSTPSMSLQESDLAFFFPVLPPSVTGLPDEIRRIAYRPTIIESN